ncbi:MAG: hypothetical protein RLZZ500_1165 [Bacteroidota bacterium]|jgi:uncharacterized membrane protein
MSTVAQFLTPEEEKAVVAAIQDAEKATSGEIRVHLEQTLDKDAMERALEVFYQLKMDATAQRNGVLIYIAVESRQFTICGDQGIHEKVGANFWDATKELMQSYFRQGENCKALCEGIRRAGEQLKSYFPYQADDIDELSNEISKG